MFGSSLIFGGKIIYIPIVVFVLSLGLDIVALIEGANAPKLRRVANWLAIIGACVFIPIFVFGCFAGKDVVGQEEPYVLLQLYFAWGAFVVVTLNTIMRIFLLHRDRGNTLRLFALVASILALSLTVWIAETASMILKK